MYCFCNLKHEVCFVCFCKPTKQRRGIIPGRDKSKEYKTTWYSVISKSMCASIPGPAHSLFTSLKEPLCPKAHHPRATSPTQTLPCYSLLIRRALQNPIPSFTSNGGDREIGT